MNFRPCGDCTICCSGALVGEANGHQFGQGKKCHYLVQEKCTIYNDRPETCRKYFCAWSQGIFPEWMKPDLVNVIINRSTQNGIKYYVLVEAGSLLDVKVLSWMIQWALNNNQNLMYYIDGGLNRIGSKEFLELST